MFSNRLIFIFLFFFGLGNTSIAATTAYNFEKGAAATTLALSSCTSSDTTGGRNWDDTHKLRMKPSYYSIKVHSLHLCTEKPYAESMTPSGSVYEPANGDAFIKDSCAKVFENTAGSEVEVIDGVNGGLTGTITRPPNNTYPYYLLSVGNEFKFKATMDFTGTDGVIKPYCVTTEGSQTSITKTQYASCSSSAGATPGLLTAKKISFGNRSTGTFKRVGFNECKDDGGCTDPRGIYIVDENGNFISDTDNTTPANIFSIKSFNTPITITDSTSMMNIIIANKKGFLVLKNPKCSISVDDTEVNINKDKVRVGTTSWKVKIDSN